MTVEPVRLDNAMSNLSFMVSPLQKNNYENRVIYKQGGGVQIRRTCQIRQCHVQFKVKVPHVLKLPLEEKKMKVE